MRDSNCVNDSMENLWWTRMLFTNLINTCHRIFKNTTTRSFKGSFSYITIFECEKGFFYCSIKKILKWRRFTFTWTLKLLLDRNYFRVRQSLSIPILDYDDNQNINIFSWWMKKIDKFIEKMKFLVWKCCVFFQHSRQWQMIKLTTAKRGFFVGSEHDIVQWFIQDRKKEFSRFFHFFFLSTFVYKIFFTQRMMKKTEKIAFIVVYPYYTSREQKWRYFLHDFLLSW